MGRCGKFFEPLAAIYLRELLTLAQAALARGLLREREITADELPWFENWNAPLERRDRVI